MKSGLLLKTVFLLISLLSLCFFYAHNVKGRILWIKERYNFIHIESILLGGGNKYLDKYKVQIKSTPHIYNCKLKFDSLFDGQIVIRINGQLLLNSEVAAQKFYFNLDLTESKSYYLRDGTYLVQVDCISTKPNSAKLVYIRLKNYLYGIETPYPVHLVWEKEGLYLQEKLSSQYFYPHEISSMNLDKLKLLLSRKSPPFYFLISLYILFFLIFYSALIRISVTSQRFHRAFLDMGMRFSWLGIFYFILFLGEWLSPWRLILAKEAFWLPIYVLFFCILIYLLIIFLENGSSKDKAYFGIFSLLFFMYFTFWPDSPGEFLRSRPIFQTINDGSHHALVTAIVEGETFEITYYNGEIGYGDTRIINGRVYSNKIPGLAFTSVPFYLAAKIIFPLFIKDKELALSADAHQNGTPYMVRALSCLAGVLSVFMIYKISRFWKIASGASMLSAVFFGFGTLHWKYSRMYFAHSLTVCLVLASFMLLIKVPRTESPRKLILASVILLGWGLLTDYLACFFILPWLLYLFLTCRGGFNDRLFYPILYMGIVCAIFAGILFWYRWQCFGDPFILEVHDSISSSSNIFGFSSAFSRSVTEGWQYILWRWPSDTGFFSKGVYSMSPYLFLNIAGVVIMFKRGFRKELICIVMIVLIWVIFCSKLCIISEEYLMFDTRYFLPAVPFLALPCGFVIDWIGGIKKLFIKYSLILVIVILWIVSSFSVARSAYF